MVHAENHDIISWLTERLLAAGHTAPRFHGWRMRRLPKRTGDFAGDLVGVELVERAIPSCTSRHVRRMEQIVWRRRAASKFTARPAPISVPDHGRSDRDGFEGAKYMCSLRRATRPTGGDLARTCDRRVRRVLVRPRRLRYNDPEGKMKHGRNASFKKVANGVPGLEVRTALLFSRASVRAHRLPQFVALTATNAAKLSGFIRAKAP